MPELDLTGSSRAAPAPGARAVRPAPAQARASGLRLMPAPESAPPFDDEQAGRPLYAARSLQRQPAPAPAAPVLRLVPERPAQPEAPGQEAEPHRGRTPTAELPAARPVARALVQRLLETSAGVRPVRQLQRDMSPELYGRVEGDLSARPAASRRPSPRDVRSIHVQERPDGLVEVCATVHREWQGRPRLGAVALRLEGHAGRWICTALDGM